MNSIVVAASNPSRAKKIAAVLHSGGLFVSAAYSGGAQVIGFAGKHYHGGVIVCELKLQDMTALSLPQTVGPKYDFLFLVGPQFAGMAENLPYARLMLPVSRRSLIESVGMLLSLSEATPSAVRRKLGEEGFDPREEIRQAKILLREKYGMTEPQAHRFLQKKSMNMGKRMAETAFLVLHS